MSQPESPLIALVTYRDKPELTSDDALLVPELERRGARVLPVPWDDPSADWSRCAAAVVRSTWDYHHQLEKFTEWTAQLDDLKVPLINSSSLLCWNSEKTYLKQLQSSGVDVVATHWVCRGDQDSLRDILRAAQWNEAVVKPVVSASAYETWRTSLASADRQEERFRALADQGEVMVQPYVPEIETAGEWSIVYLGNHFSHAVVKRPQRGDFRVQKQFGGSREIVEPDPELLRAAEAILSHAPEQSVYARVDGCVIAGRFVLMELELIEPELFLETHPLAPARFASAILDTVEDNS